LENYDTRGFVRVGHLTFLAPRPILAPKKEFLQKVDPLLNFNTIRQDNDGKLLKRV
jgi:hypothetical protein